MQENSILKSEDILTIEFILTSLFFSLSLSLLSKGQVVAVGEDLAVVFKRILARTFSLVI